MKTNHRSYGIIPIYKQGDDVFICCVHNRKSDAWGLPKGTPENDETPFETAKRELREETGIEKFEIFGGKTFSEKYSFEEDGIMHHKENTYYLATVDEMIDKKSDIDSKDMRWININEAEEFFIFDALKQNVREVKKYLNQFPIISEYHGASGEDVIFEYYESDSIEHLSPEHYGHVAMMAFHDDKLLIVNNTTKPGTYGPVVGSIEKGEKPEEAVVRELKEESNTRPIEMKLIGYQKCINVTHPETPHKYQFRYFAKVEPIGPFTPDCDPDGDVTELLKVDPADYKKYFDWKVPGELIMKRALEFLGD